MSSISIIETIVVGVVLVIHFCTNTKKVTKVEIDGKINEESHQDSVSALPIDFYRDSILDTSSHVQLQESLEGRFRDIDVAKIEPLKKYLLSVSPHTYLQFLQNVIETVNNFEGFSYQHIFLRNIFLPLRPEFQTILNTIFQQFPPITDLKNIVSYNRLLYDLMYHDKLSKNSEDFVSKCLRTPGYDFIHLFGRNVASFLNDKIYHLKPGLMNININHAQFIAYVFVQISLCDGGDINDFFQTLYKCIFRFRYENMETEIERMKNMNISKIYYKRKALIEVLYQFVITNNTIFQLIPAEKLALYSLFSKKFKELFPSKNSSKKDGDYKATLEKYGIVQSFKDELVKIMFPHLLTSDETISTITDQCLYRSTEFTLIGALRVPIIETDSIHNNILYMCILYRDIFAGQEEEMKKNLKDTIFEKVLNHVLSLFSGVHRPVIKYWATIHHEKKFLYFPVLSPGLNWIDKDYRCERTYMKYNPYECLKNINESLLEIMQNCKVHSLPSFLNPEIPRHYFQIQTYYLPKRKVNFEGRFVISHKISYYEISANYLSESCINDSIYHFNGLMEDIEQLVENINCCH